MRALKLPRGLALFGPGLLVAATGVGAGDLATAGFAGSKIGVGILWAVVVGAFLKFVLNEGLARWQLATGETLIEGAADELGRGFAWVFLPYLVFWSFFVGSALMSACGVTLHAILPVFEDASRAKVVFGIVHSLVGAALVLAGGFPLFERVMSVCIGVMFVTVVAAAALLWPGTEAVLSGLFLPDFSTLSGQRLAWSVALIGGVGGTVTVLCYGYWIREAGREGPEELTACRIDLGAGYAMTALFGIAMVILGSHVELGDARGASLVVDVSSRLEGELGGALRWMFLAGAWGAVFSSLLGVWQSVPYLFADAWNLARGRGPRRVETKSRGYRGYLAFLALAPMLGLVVRFELVQRAYAIVGACFLPLLAFALLVLNGNRRRVGDLLNRLPTRLVLVATVAFFGWILVDTVRATVR